MTLIEKILFLCLLSFIEIFVYAQLDVGDRCGANNDKRCVLVEDCPDAVYEIIQRKRHNLERCGWEGKNEIVCCKIVEERFPPRKSEEECVKYWEVSSTDPTPFIIKGFNATLGQFPHMAALGYENDADGTIVWGDCGGSLISKNFVLTAAHCVITPNEKEPVVVRLGKVDLFGDADGVQAQDIRVAKSIAYPGYKHFERRHDIALLQLEKDVEINKYVKPICLFTDKVVPLNTGLIISGWGSTENETTSRFLLGGYVMPYDLNKCNKTYLESSKKTLFETNLCAFSTTGDDTCQGDSGGPIQIENRKDNKVTPLILVGVTAFGRGCGGPYPSVYTRVSSYVTWIEGLVWT